MNVQYREKTSDVGAGQQIVTIVLGVGKWEVIAASVVPDSSFSTPGRIIYAVREGGENKYVHLCSGHATSNIPLCLETPRTVEGPGAIVSVFYHVEATDGHTLYAAFRRI